MPEPAPVITATPPAKAVRVVFMGVICSDSVNDFE
jgi:hypothetical protein